MAVPGKLPRALRQTYFLSPKGVGGVNRTAAPRENPSQPDLPVRAVSQCGFSFSAWNRRMPGIGGSFTSALGASQPEAARRRKGIRKQTWNRACRFLPTDCATTSLPRPRGFFPTTRPCARPLQRRTDPESVLLRPPCAESRIFSADNAPKQSRTQLAANNARSVSPRQCRKAGKAALQQMAQRGPGPRKPCRPRTNVALRSRPRRRPHKAAPAPCLFRSRPD